MKTFILLFITCVHVVSHSFADDYPIDPRPLRRLVLESQYIVTGTVKEIKANAMTKKGYDDDREHVIIVIHEVLQGNIEETEIRVSNNPHYICPAPARYTVGTTVVAFLNKNKKDNVFTTHALSYGAKTVSDEGRDAYAARIREIQKINTQPEGLDKFLATVEWLVKCAEHKETRWEGTYELSPESDFMSYYARSEHQPFSSMLSPEQRARLRHTLLSSSEADYADLGLIDLVYVGNEKEIHAFMLKALKKVSGANIYFAGAFMERLKLLTNDPQLDSLITRYEKIVWEDRKGKESKQIIDEFVALLEKK